jgi:hypothetical protein
VTVGIVQWARRSRGACEWELAAADALGRQVASTSDITVRLALVGRARRHGWRASQWEAVVPVLHDVDAAADSDDAVAAALARLAAAPDGDAALAADGELAVAAVTAWRRWAADAGPVADAPYRRAAERCLADVAAQAL